MTSTDLAQSPAEQDFVPPNEWPAVTVMLDGFGDPSLEASEKLAGRALDIVFDDGRTIAHEFAPDTITWRITDGEGAGASGTHAYRAVEARPGIFYIDFVKGEGTHQEDVTIIVDLADGRVTTAASRFVNRDGEVRMTTDVSSGRVAGTGEIEPRERTSSLVGKRIYYRYSPTEHYEHIYLNAGTIVWQCVRGGEKGLADVEQIRVWELADDIVMLHWTETVMPVESFVLIDLAEQRSIGRMYCWDGPTLSPVHLPFDSRLTVLNETVYPAE